ncbi:enoyl-CoA hydratase/isomerase family protein [Corynebacterium kroppenstedtii]|uniref:enoyl-CoA hydratase/isomerase family protein n=1 Tax=Corynebacterium kroppenstedtii TaxID=161879 RepID=UPI00264C4784|nr:enoyl-CoA hydratase-related protein [Corynebacterium kroppenstedtii]MDN8625223.1 enoyl-CoA hydratase-related protein [Corynebacterium kroppenstedtii]
MADEQDVVGVDNLDVETGTPINAADAASGVVRVITLRRPEGYNAINKALRSRLHEEFDSANDPSIRAVLLNAEGKSFCVGQDLKEHLQDLSTGQGMGKVVDEYNPMIEALLAIKVPVVAAISGPAAGAGWSLALNCDFRIASRTASFTASFAGVGLASDCGLSHTLTSVVGPARALEVLYRDQQLTAERAYDLGLVTEVTDNDRAEEAATKFALALAQGPTKAFCEIKSLVKDEQAVMAAATREADAQARLAFTEDHQEAVRSFVEKRKPQFRGC